ncbi:hypothetical protein EJ03DRAFT_161466 [Teratosphaeria nubilosa]|uniref:Uncharacterized protein n=1 Tax=Teratosphaeria nubilosa TaxID=161662 RepID=A0A6G1L2A4_9PEZI|nr:hypothetical protein EJ03DRAFT_161466 [Teratosphaeria nubilosa]
MKCCGTIALTTHALVAGTCRMFQGTFGDAAVTKSRTESKDVVIIDVGLGAGYRELRANSACGLLDTPPRSIRTPPRSRLLLSVGLFQHATGPPTPGNERPRFACCPFIDHHDGMAATGL